MNSAELPSGGVDPTFEQMIVENMSGSFLRETSGDTLGNFYSGGTPDVVPLPPVAPLEHEIPFGVAAAQELSDLAASGRITRRVGSSYSTSPKETQEWDTGDHDSKVYKDD